MASHLFDGFSIVNHILWQFDFNRSFLLVESSLAGVFPVMGLKLGSEGISCLLHLPGLALSRHGKIQLAGRNVFKILWCIVSGKIGRLQVVN